MNPSTPPWLIPTIVSLLISLLSVWGAITAAKATLEVRMKRNEEDIKELWEDKVSHKEMNLILSKLDDIKKALDRHIEKDQK